VASIEQKRAVVRGPGEGETVWLGGFPHRVKLAGDETGDALAVVECDAEHGAATPVHVHHRDDETFYVAEGELAFVLGDERVRARAGSVVHLPRGVPHAFVVESQRARFLVVVSPAGHERFFAAAGAQQPLPLPPDPAALAATAAAYGVEFLGPPPVPEQRQEEER
jgi:quercetin dioxygenase-like cupin family protein